MCGISIAINKKGEQVKDHYIELMTNSVKHRGPDDEGYYQAGNIALGHKRLSIIDLTSGGHQPMKRNHLHLVYNGEIYNYTELRQELQAIGHLFHTESDSEVILAAYEQWGVQCFARLNGMWALSIFDQQKNEMILCRDHFGIKPLVYFQDEEWFLAGSEIKQFLSFENFKPLLNKEVAVNFLTNGLLNYSDQTFFKNVHELRGGHYLIYNIDKHSCKIRQWYNLKEVIKPVTDDYETAVKKIRDIFLRSVKLRMRSDVAVGSCLSGGIDSSSIVSTIYENQLANRDFATITACFEDAKYDERQYSDEVSKQTGFTALKIFPDLDHLFDKDDFDKMLYHMEQPFSGASHYNEYQIYKEAAKAKRTVLLDGQGSDEFLLGYDEFFIQHLKETFFGLKFGKMYKLLLAKANTRISAISYFVNVFLKTVFYYPAIQFGKKIIGKRKYPWLSKQWQQLLNKNETGYNGNSIQELSMNQMLYSSLPYQLHSQDRNSMMFSIESRLPFLDPALVEYCMGLPHDFRLKGGVSKKIFRDAIVSLPPKVKDRTHKMGFEAPDADWIRSHKEKIRAELVEIKNTTFIFSQDLITRFDKFINGEIGYEPVYFRAITFYRFCKIFNLSFSN